MMENFIIPNLHTMSDDEVNAWVASLTTDIVYKYLVPITEALTHRCGLDARVSTSTYQSPKIVYLVENSA